MDTPIKNITVMIVDETFTHRQFMQNVLKNIGFSNCIDIDNGEDARNSFESNDIGLVISEIQLPKFSGIELFSFLLHKSTQDAHKQLKFLFYTGYGNEENIKSILKIAEGFTPDQKKWFKYDLILKPLRVDKLLAKLQNLFSEDQLIKKHLNNELSKLG